MVDRISHAAQDWHMYTSPEISKQIFDVLRAAQLMEEADLDVTLVHTPFNFGYVTDYNYFEAGPDFLMEDGQLYYDAFAGVMRDCPQDSFMVCCTAEEGDVTWRDPWIKDRRFWGPRFMVTAGKQQTEVKPDPITTVVAALLERGMESARVGLEMSQIKHVHFEALSKMLPRATFVNAEPALWQLRLVKSPEEVSRLRVAARAVSRAAEAAFRSARAGMTELEMERIILRSVVEDGCRPYSVELAFGPKGAYSVAPTSNCLQPGQIMRVDVTAFYKGYVADISRVAAFGIVGDRAERAHRAILHANQALQNAVRPGITGAELRMLEMDTFGQEGLAPLIPMAGHGVGRVVHEFPFLTEADHTRLQPGITVTIEPSIRLHGVGSVNIEDTVVVTQSGVECLTTAARGLYDYA